MFSKFAFEHMVYQSMLSHQCRVLEFYRMKPKSQKDQQSFWTGQYVVREWVGEYVNFRVHLSFADRPQFGPLIGFTGGHLPPHLQPLTNVLLQECFCDCEYFISFNLLCQHIFAVFNVLQLKRIGHCYKQFSRWLRLSENDDYFNDNLLRGIENPFFVKLSEKERLYYLQEDLFADSGRKWEMPLDGQLID